MRNLVLQFSRRARAQRADLFRQNFPLGAASRILDIGSEDGSNINFVLRGTDVNSENVFIADIDPQAIAAGQEKFGYVPVLLDETGRLPFPDQFFDVVYCSSVIEHVTVEKDEVWRVTDGAQFRAASRQNQKRLADEIRRVGRSYFVQTPHRHFPVESHSWLPLVAFLPRPWLVRVLGISNRWWIKKTIPDFHLLDARELKTLFPEAAVLTERKFGMVKSIIAVKTEVK